MANGLEGLGVPTTENENKNNIDSLGAGIPIGTGEGVLTNKDLPPDLQGMPTQNPTTTQGAKTPLTNFDPEQPIFATDGSLENINPKATMAGQFRELYKEGSPVRSMFEAEGIRTAQSRGLQNATMAAQAGVAGGAKAISDIAAADSSFFGGLEKQNQLFGQQKELSGIEHEQQKELEGIRNEYDIGKLVKQYELDDNSKAKLHEYNKELEGIRNDFAIKLDELNYNQELQGTLLNITQNILGSGLSDIASMAASPDVTEVEYNAFKKSLTSVMKTITEFWKIPAGSDDVFDFSDII